MLNICSLIQKFFGFIKTIQKKIYRTCAVFVSGAAVFAIVSLSFNDFGGSGKNKTDADHEKSNQQTEFDSDEDETDGNALIENELFNYVRVDNNAAQLRKEKINLLVSLLNSDYGNNDQLQMNPTIIPNMNRMLLSKTNDFTNNKNNINAEGTNTSENTTQNPETTVVSTEQTTTVEQTTENIVQETETTQNQETDAPVSNDCVQNSVIDLSEDDYYWLCQIVEAEAGNQDDIGKILIVNVIANRINSDIFPSTVKDVVFQHKGSVYQFEPVKNGRINRVTATSDTINCVDRALAGEDYSQGALFFTMRTSKYSWFNQSLRLLFVHGDHYFYAR